MENKNPTSKTLGNPTASSASLKLLERMKAEGIETIYDRYQTQQPQCGYGQLALCCRHCNWGPCNIDPFGKGPKKGVCGAEDRKSTRLNSSHSQISYAVFCLKKK